MASHARSTPRGAHCYVATAHRVRAMPHHPERREGPPAVSPRLLRLAVPLLVVVTAAFGLYQLFVAGIALRTKAYPFALLYAVMGLAGLAVASALWRTGKRLR